MSDFTASDRDSDSEYQDEEQVEDVDDHDEEDDSEDNEKPRRMQTRSSTGRTSTRPQVPPSSQQHLYTYQRGLTDEQRRLQDVQNFAEAAKSERRTETVADKNRDIRFDADGNLLYTSDRRTWGKL